MHFADEAIKEMSAGYAAVHGKLNTLVEAYILREFTNPRAREHASQGFPRRLKDPAGSLGFADARRAVGRDDQHSELRVQRLWQHR